MWAFQYKHGDRPLEGYTIERAAGRGGFGEVYYAISDSGREVALKAVTGYEQIELRGISQCMNHKNPHLVSIFDVKYNAQGRPFVIMEYVSGPSLRQLIDESPSGLGEQKSAFFLREISKGLTFLHDCGIVHRDLKPGNIFYENGYVKIGDYGLSKAITTSQHSGQTVTVGTVHYMAPEIGAGKYDRSIDIYAMGAVLYEMLTGAPPFVGASASEVLLKHLSAQPDCAGINEPFAGAIKKAMAKDPAERFQTIQEMVEAVFGAEHIQQSMSVFSPQDLSMVAERAARYVGAVAVTAPQIKRPAQPPPLPTNDNWERMARKFERIGDQVVDRVGQFGSRIGHRRLTAEVEPDLSRDMTVPIEDPLPLRPRLFLTAVTTCVIAMAAMVLAPTRSSGGPVVFLTVATSIFGALAGAAASRKWLQSRGLGRHVLRFMDVGAALVGMMALSSVFWMSHRIISEQYIPAVLGLAISGMVLNLGRRLRPNRSERVSIRPVLAAGFIGLLVALTADEWAHTTIAVTAGTFLAAQALFPWDPRQAAARKAEARQRHDEARAQAAAPNVAPAKAPNGNGNEAVKQVNQVNQPAPKVPQGVPMHRIQRFALAPVVPAIRYVWLGVFAVAFSLSIAFFVAAGMARRGDDIAAFGAAGVGFAALSILSMIRFLAKSYFGIWNYLIRPLLAVIAFTTSASSLMVMAIAPHEVRGAEGVAIFFIVFPLIVMTILFFIPGKVYRTLEAPDAAPANPAAQFTNYMSGHSGVSPFKRLWALLLAGIGLFGAAGIHRFYVGKIVTGIIWLVTGGLFGIGTIIDMIMIAVGSFTDKRGRRLLIWEEPEELAMMPQQAEAVIVEERPVVRASLPSHAAGLLSALAGLLLFIGTMLCLVLALELPAAVQTAVFGEQMAQEVLDVFSGYAGWANLVERVMALIAGLTLLGALIVMMFARRRAGTIHQVRGMAGILGLLAAMSGLHDAFQRGQAWPQVAAVIEAEGLPAALDTFLGAWQPPQMVAAGIIGIVSLFLLALPKPVQNERPAEQQTYRPQEKAGVA